MPKEDVLTMKGTWVFLAPIEALILTAAVKREFRVNQVLFVSGEKLPRIRKRLGLHMPVSHYKNTSFGSRFFDGASAFAVFRRTGRPAKLKSSCLRLVQDELAVICLSQLGYSKRRFNSHPRLRGQASVSKLSDMFLNTANNAWGMHNWLSGKYQPLALDRDWLRYQKQVFFLRLMRMLYGKSAVSKGWRQDLRRAAILAGQSQASDSIAQAFLWNMIALELLLTKQGDKYSDTLPKRIEAFLGWAGYWEVKGYEKSVRGVYQKRCAFVHDGAWDQITIEDLLFTDDLLLNLFANIARHPKLFHSKEAVVQFADKVAAEHLLGMKSRVRPKTLWFISRKYTAKDLEEI